jgi:hypothetical protein
VIAVETTKVAIPPMPYLELLHWSRSEGVEPVGSYHAIVEDRRKALPDGNEQG